MIIERIPSFHMTAATMQVGVLKNEKGEKGTTDTLQSKADPSVTPKESWKECFTRWFWFVPNLIWTCFKKVLCVLTCGFICNEKPSAAEIKAKLADVITVFEKKESTNEQKEAAWKKFSIPEAIALLVQGYVDKIRASKLHDKATADEIQKWEKDNAAAVQEEAKKLFEKQPSLKVLQEAYKTI